MALRLIRIGSLLNAFQYDDDDYDSAAETDQPIKAGTPTDPNDVVRLIDLVGYVIGPAAAVDGNVAIFDGITGKILRDSGIASAEVVAIASIAENDFIVSNAALEWEIRTLAQTRALLAQLVYDPDYKCYVG